MEVERRPTKKSAYENNDIKIYRKEAMKAARDLCYGEEVQRRIKNAKTVDDISRIMKSARLRGK